MDALKIRGGQSLSGSVDIGGAKNACLPILAATLLAPGKHQLTNVPELADVRTMGQLLRTLGAEVSESGRHAVTVQSDRLASVEAPYDLVRTMRASVLVLGPLVAREGRCRVSLPGGCAIGARPIDQHLKGLAALGADIELVHGYVEAKAKTLRGAEFTFDMVTVTGTENVLMAAVRARGETILRNCALEPEIDDLVKALRGMGARIEGEGTPVLRIQGVEALQPMQHAVMRDRIEAGTFAAAAAMCRGDVRLEGAQLAHFGAVADRMRDAGATLTQEDHGVRVFGPTRLRAVDIKTAPFPAFATDMQAQFMAMMCVAEGSSIITETVFENRYMHVPELQRLGANLTVVDGSVIARGQAKLMGATVMATDLRASASLILAGLAAEGETTVRRIYHLDRGYEAIERKLSGLGADIERVKE
jgi:UDP-N-acetylglucosamine 1-carboxyvinyltransferase